MKFSIIIPTWNGKELLQKNLPKVLAAIEEEEAEAIVVDNGSTDDSLELLKNFAFKKGVRIIKLSKNYGFAYACKLGVKRARGKIVVLLNNDVVPQKNFLKPLKKDFAKTSVFAVSFHEPQYSWARGEFKKGFLVHGIGPKTKNPHISFWANGGSGAFRKRIWIKLGGFDQLFHPFYWEDLDLCYRAWKRGYQVFWEPKSVVYHQHESTVSRFSQSYVDLIKQRNELLFIWKNITSQGLIKEHKKFLAARLTRSPGYFKVFLAALFKLPRVFWRRNREKKETKLTDEEIFKKFTP